MIISVFFLFFEATVVASVVILFLKLIFSLFSQRYSSKYKYWIWLIIAVFLAVPLRFRFAEPLVSINVPVSAISSYHLQSAVWSGEKASLKTQLEPEATSSISSDNRHFGFTYLDFIAVIWPAGAAAFLLTHLVIYLKYKKTILARSTYPKNKRLLIILDRVRVGLCISRKITLLINPALVSPSAIGYIRQYILLPTEEYTNAELYYILKHECIHIRRNDCCYKMFLLLVTALHWYNFVVHFLLAEAFIDLEISCDEEVSKHLTKAQKLAYCRTILSSVCTTSEKHCILSSNLQGGKEMLKLRFLNLINQSKKKGRTVILMVTLCLLAFTILISCNHSAASNNLPILNEKASILSDEQAKSDVTSNRQISRSDIQEPVAADVLIGLESSIYDIEELKQLCISETFGYQNKAQLAEEKLQEVYKQIEWSENTISNEQLIWPSPNNQTIASDYGWRFDGYDFHLGVDITGVDCYGDDIIAINSGIVQYVEKEWIAGEGLGQYLILDHGGGISTLYAQCSDVIVNIGDSVESGQKIAEIGSSGLSTGAHLHFEIRTNGIANDPIEYYADLSTIAATSKIAD